MSKKELKDILSKYINNHASETEIEQLLEWLKEEENLKLFNDYIAVDHYLNAKYKKVDSVDAYKKAMALYDKKRRRPFYKYAAAASIVILIATGIWLTKMDSSDSQFLEPIIVNNNITPGHDQAILTLETGKEVALVKGTSYETQNVTSNGEEIIYNSNTSRELVYNHLTVPRGGQFQLTLSDGTRVWLNSESQLKYPVSFADGENRQVELVYGEAYFDVSPGSEHNGATFKVFNSNQEVEVLGTEFNIRAYKDETNIYTTLVEGKVAVSIANQGVVLTPNDQSNLDVKTSALLVSVVNVKNEISWKEGVFRFKGTSLERIMKVLSRWYDMDVIFENKELKGDIVTFKGVLGRNQSIQTILSAIKNSKAINNYEINDKMIILK